MKLLNNILNWYFSKNSLPYWCILIIDSIIIGMSGLLVYWLFWRTSMVINHRFELFYTLLLYISISMVGFKIFRTYSGIMRYSSFVDLQKVAYANMVSVVVAYLLQFVKDFLPEGVFTLFSGRMLLSMFLMATSRTRRIQRLGWLTPKRHPL